jgi:hypothetical protein
MVTRRTAKSKGNQFEYDCQASLQPCYSDIYRTAERGFQRQYDLRSDFDKVVFECKRLKGISWNQCKKFFDKLESKKPEDYKGYLLFQSNRQPCLVMYKGYFDIIEVCEFKDKFNLPFIKHKSTRAKMHSK